jgi:hypothetical protein
MTDKPEALPDSGEGTPFHGDDLGAGSIENDREPSPGESAGTRHGRAAEPGEAPPGTGN